MNENHPVYSAIDFMAEQSKRGLLDEVEFRKRRNVFRELKDAATFNTDGESLAVEAYNKFKLIEDILQHAVEIVENSAFLIASLETVDALKTSGTSVDPVLIDFTRTTYTELKNSLERANALSAFKQVDGNVRIDENFYQSYKNELRGNET